MIKFPSGINNFEKLSSVEKIAKASRWKRFLQQPVRYLSILLWDKFIYPLSKKGKLRSTHTFFGTPIEVLLPAGMDIYLLGAKSHDSEIRLTRWLLHHLKHGQTFLDVGAHFGFFSLLASSLVGEEGRVISFEAAPNTVKLLNSNTKSYPNISVVHRAVSDEKGVLTFYEFPIQYSEYNTLHPDQFESENWFNSDLAKRVEVESIVLDDYLKRHQIIPDCIKIDVEGAEEKVLNGLLDFLQEKQPTLLVECTLLSLERHLSMQQTLANIDYFPFALQPNAELRAVFDIERYLKEKKLESDNFVFLKV